MDESNILPTSGDNEDETKLDASDVHSFSPTSDVPDLISFSDESDYCKRLKYENFLPDEKARIEKNGISLSYTMGVQSFPTASNVSDLIFSDKNDYCNGLAHENVLAEEKARGETNEVPLSNTMNVHSLPPASDVPDLISLLDEPGNCNELKDVFDEGNARKETKSISLTEKCFQRISSDDMLLLTRDVANQESSTLNEKKYLDPGDCYKLLKLESEGTHSKSSISDTSCIHPLVAYYCSRFKDQSLSQEQTPVNEMIKFAYPYSKSSISDTSCIHPLGTHFRIKFKDQSLCQEQTPVNEMIKSASPEIPCSECLDPETTFPGKMGNKGLYGSVSCSFGDCYCNSDLFYYNEKKKSLSSMEDLKILENNISDRQLKLETHSLSADERASSQKYSLENIVSDCLPRVGSPTSKVETESSLTDDFSSTLPVNIESSSTNSSEELETSSSDTSESYSSSSSSSDNYYYGDDEDIQRFVKLEEAASKASDKDCDWVAGQDLHISSKEHLETPKSELEPRNAGSMGNLSDLSDVNKPLSEICLTEREEFSLLPSNEIEETVAREHESIEIELHDYEAEDNFITEEEFLFLQDRTIKHEPLLSKRGNEIEEDTTEDPYYSLKKGMMKDEAPLSDSGGEFEDGDTSEEQSNSLESSDLDGFRLKALGLLFGISVRSSVSRKYGKQTWTSRRKWREPNRKRGYKRQSHCSRNLEPNEEYGEMNPNGKISESE